MKITVPISVGELLDKITILQIKSLHSDNSFIIKELNDLIKIAKDNSVYLEDYIKILFEINLTLWTIEDDIRKLEKEKDFSSEFIELARKVYLTNDERARVKKEINELMNSEYQEVKVFKI